jgi:hypothetical protein
MLASPAALPPLALPAVLPTLEVHAPWVCVTESPRSARTLGVCHTEVCVDGLRASAGAVQHIVDGHLAIKHTGAEHTRDGGAPLQVTRKSHASATTIAAREVHLLERQGQEATHV